MLNVGPHHKYFRSRMINIKPLILIPLVLLGACSETFADTRGRVLLWNEFTGVYKPANSVLITAQDSFLGWEVARDVTDSDGEFRMVFNNQDVSNLTVYTETPDLLRVYGNAYVWQYSYETVGISDVMEIRIGRRWPDTSGTFPARRPEVTEEEDAIMIALMAHQQMVHHADILETMGLPWVPVDAIIPAWTGDGSYYNHMTGLINLTASSHLGWSVPNRNPELLSSDIPVMFEVVRHEYNHALHDFLENYSTPWGLISPVPHDILVVTNLSTAYTEGWAAFLPMVTLGRPDLYSLPSDRSMEESAAIPNSDLIPIPDGTVNEGHIAAFFWDLYDGIGLEPVRNVVNISEDDTTVPTEIQDAQMFEDLVGNDADLSIFRNIFARAGTISTIVEFLPPLSEIVPEYALKSLAFNQQILIGIPPNTAATLQSLGPIRPTLRGWEIPFTINEADTVDHGHVEVGMWLRRGRSSTVDVIKFYGERFPAQDWDNTLLTRIVVLPVDSPALAARGINFPVGQLQPDDELWVMVNDGMFPVVIRIPLAGVIEPGTAGEILPSWQVESRGNLIERPIEADLVSTDSGISAQPWIRSLGDVPLKAKEPPKIDSHGHLKERIEDEGLVSSSGISGQSWIRNLNPLTVANDTSSPQSEEGKESDSNSRLSKIIRDAINELHDIRGYEFIAEKVATRLAKKEGRVYKDAAYAVDRLMQIAEKERTFRKHVPKLVRQLESSLKATAKANSKKGEIKYKNAVDTVAALKQELERRASLSSTAPDHLIQFADSLRQLSKGIDAQQVSGDNGR